jgi:hypothetical protein
VVGRGMDGHFFDSATVDASNNRESYHVMAL